MQGLTAATDKGEVPTLPSGRLERRRAGFAGSRLADATVSPQQKHRLDAVLLARYARTRLSGSFAMAALILMAASIASIWLPSASIALWTSLTLCAHTLLAVLCFCYRAPNRIATRSWTGLFVGAELLCGLSWIGLFALLSDATGLEATIFQFATLLVVIAASTTLTASLSAAAMAATVPMVLAMVALFALRHEPLYFALAGLALSIEIFFLSLSQRAHNATRSQLEHRAEQERLAAALAEAHLRAEQSLRVADEANLARSRFLSTMNHELRTPLNAILGFSEVMKNEVLGPMQNGTYREYAGDIHASGGHLLALIDQILDLSGLEAGRYELQEEPVDLVDLVRGCGSLVGPRIVKRGLNLVVEVEPDLPPLHADPRGLRQILLNLLSNAIKFTPEGGEITLQAGWTAGGGQYVAVRDNGPGIAAGEMAVVLSPFGQGENTIRMAEPGAGLGLPMVEAITRLHGGTFELRSAPGAGTLAIASFPRVRVTEPSDTVTQTSETNVVLWRSAS